MVNSKKSSKSLIALVVMALLLVASIALAATGAWFSDIASGTGNGTFGTIDVGDTVTVTVDSTIMPGDKITVTPVAYAGTADAYYKVSVSFSGEGAGALSSSAGAVYGKVSKDGNITVADITIPGEGTDNTYQGKAVTVTVTIEAIQADNVTVTGDTDAAKAESAFASITASERD